MISKQTVFIVIRTLTVEIDCVVGTREIDAMPVVEGVFTSYEAANDFVDPLLDSRSEGIEYTILEKEVQ